MSVSGTKGMAQVRHGWLSWDGSKYWEPGPLVRGIGQLWLFSQELIQSEEDLRVSLLVFKVGEKNQEFCLTQVCNDINAK